MTHVTSIELHCTCDVMNTFIVSCRRSKFLPQTTRLFLSPQPLYLYIYIPLDFIFGLFSLNKPLFLMLRLMLSFQIRQDLKKIKSYPRGKGQVENVSSVSPACRKRRLKGAVSRNNRIKRLAPCRCLDGHVKEPYEMSMALGARP